MLLLAVGLSLSLATALLWNAAFALRGRLANWLAIATLVSAQIVLLSEVLSELQAIGRAGFLAGHLILLAASFVLWWERGHPSLRKAWWFSPGEVLHSSRQHLLLATFAVLVLGMTLLNPIPRPHWEFDALAYHLPRAYFWKQAGTARHFYTGDFRQVQFPPNPSFHFMWMMVLSGGYAGLHIPQWVAGLVTAAGTAALARAAGHGRASSLFSGLVFLTFPMVILQMVTSFIDLLTAAPGVCFVYFALHALQEHARDVSLRQNHAVIYAGMTFGLFVGSKLTALFMLPGAGLALLLYAFLTLRKSAIPPLTALAASCVLGLGIFGAYNYVLNVIDFGSPFAADEAVEDVMRTHDSYETPAVYSFGGNLGRYIYQTMDWTIVASLPGNRLAFELNNAITRGIDQALGLNLEAVNRFALDETGYRALKHDTAGYGPAGYLVMVISPLLMIFFAVRHRQSSRFATSALYIAMSWSWLLLFSAIMWWTPYRIRFFVIFMPMLIAATIPWCYCWRRTAFSVALVLIMLSALWTCAWTTWANKSFQSAVTSPSGAGYDRLEELLDESMPIDATLGISGFRVTFPLMQRFPDYHFVNVPPDDIPMLLETGQLDAVVADPEEVAGHLSPLPFPRVESTAMLYVADPAGFIWHHRDYYRFDLVQTADGPVLNVTGRRLIHYGGQDNLATVDIYLPTVGPLSLGQDVQIDLDFSDSVALRDVVELACNAQAVEYEFEQGALTVYLRGEVLSRNMPYQVCRIVLPTSETGDQPTIEMVTARSR